MRTLRYFLPSIAIGIFFLSNVKAQDIKTSLDAANSSYASSESLIARENLQKALIDINNLIGEEILGLMPKSLGGLVVDATKDNIVGNTGFAGLIVSRTYGSNSNKDIDVTIANDSPMLAMVNSFLGNSMMSGLMASQTGQKQITISGYKGMIEKNDGEEGPIVYTLNIPLKDSLFTFETTGFNNDSEVISMAEQMNLDKIGGMLK